MAWQRAQFWLNAEDAKVIEYLKIFSSRTRDEIAELEIETEQAPHKRAAQRVLANDITDLVHGRPEREAAELAALPTEQAVERLDKQEAAAALEAAQAAQREAAMKDYWQRQHQSAPHQQPGHGRGIGFGR